MRVLSSYLDEAVRKILAKHHPIFAELVISWCKIVGSDLGAKIHPCKFISAQELGREVKILYLQIENPLYSLELSLQQEVIIERISVYFGAQVVDRLRLIHHPKQRNHAGFRKAQVY